MMAVIADLTLATPAPPPPRLGPGIFADGNAAAGTLSIQFRIEHRGRVGLFDDVLSRGWLVLTTAMENTLPAEAQQVLDRLGGRLLRVDPAGREAGQANEAVVIDIDGRYASWFSELDRDTVIIRPDFYVYAAVDKTDLPDVLHILGGQLTVPVALAAPAADNGPIRAPATSSSEEGNGMDKTVGSAADAVADIAAGSSLAVGGFGLCGIPHVLIQAVHEAGVDRLVTVSNNCGTDDGGLGVLLAAGRIRRTVSSYVGENKEFARQYLSGELELELNPQGTLAERLRAGGSGIPAFYTPAGVGTLVADGGLPWRYRSDGTVEVASPRKETREFNGQQYVLEEGIVTDYALVRAAVGDRHGNLVYEASARNFNPLCAMAGRITVAEVERLVEPGVIAPKDVHTPGIFVQRVIEVGTGGKRIEKRIVRARQEQS